MKRTIGLRTALTWLVLIAIAPVFAVVVKAAREDERGRLTRAEENLRSVVDLAAANQESLVEGVRQMLSAIAYAPPVLEGGSDRCALYMRTLQSHYPAAYGSFGMLDPAGVLTCRAEPPPSNVTSSDRPFFREAVTSGRFAVGEYTICRANGKAVLPFGLPVYAQEPGRLRGVVYLALDVSQADERLRRITVPIESTLLVADSKGTVLASTGAYPVAAGSPLPEPFMEGHAPGTPARQWRALSSDGGDWLYVIRPVGNAADPRLYVGGMASVDAILGPAQSRLQRQLLALAVIALAAAAVAWQFGDRVLARPFRRLLARVDALASEELAVDAPSMPLRELEQLDQRFADVARRLVERAVQRDGALAEAAHQAALLESVFEGMGEGVLVVDVRGRFLHVNAAAQRILGGLPDFSARTALVEATPAELGLFELDGRTPCATDAAPVQRALAGEGGPFRHIVRGRLSAGQERVIQGNARPLRGPDGRRAGAVIVFFDITDAWRAENQLRESEVRYRTLFESNPHPMWVFDAQTLRFLTVNDAAIAHYGYSRDEFLAMTIAQIRPEEDVLPLRDAVEELGLLTVPKAWRHRLKDGRLIWVEISSHSMDYDGHAARMVLAHDVTQLLDAQLALVQANETLERRVDERTRELHAANRELESFAYSVSHDLRAPLSTIDGFGSALMTRCAPQLDDQARHYLTRIRENTHSMGELIDDLLSLSSVARADLRIAEINLSPRAHQSVDRLRQRFPGREVAVEIDEDLACTGDERLLGIVLENLVENAWKFTAKTARARIHIGAKVTPGGENAIFVADNGAGFDMQYADKLFKAFHRLHTSEEFDGTGIGLATVHRIISRHSGRVWAEAEPGGGAIFQFTLGQPGGAAPGRAGDAPDSV